ncbi:MAG TPA: lipopolysaccharide kinase InaA family protein [Planctomycetota bacterium]|nr:lipopolysaccharide kinase InaA family protein [Planctomycetota bacterium]
MIEGYEVADEGRVLLLASERQRLAALGLDRLDTALTAGETLRALKYKSIARLPGLYIKRYDYDRREVFVKCALKANFHSFSGRLELENALALREAGLPVPRPLACGEAKLGWRARSFVVLEELPGTPLERLTPPVEAPERRALVRRVAGLVRALHAAGCAHRDLYVSNIIVDGERLGLVDLEKVRALKPRTRRKDLAALDYSAVKWSATDRVRFLRAYLGLEKLDAASRTLVRKVRRKSRSIARKGAKW